MLALAIIALSIADSYEWTGIPPGFAPSAAVTISVGLIIGTLIFVTFGTHIGDWSRQARLQRQVGLREYIGTALFLSLLFLLAFAVTSNYSALYILGLCEAMLALTGLFQVIRHWK